MTILPALEELEGFCSGILLVDRASGRGVAAATFDSVEAMERNKDQLDSIRATGSQEARAEVLDACDFELAIAHLRARDGLTDCRSATVVSSSGISIRARAVQVSGDAGSSPSTTSSFAAVCSRSIVESATDYAKTREITREFVGGGVGKTGVTRGQGFGR